MCEESKEAMTELCLLILVGVPPNVCRGRVWHMEREAIMAAQPFVCH